MAVQLTITMVICHIKAVSLFELMEINWLLPWKRVCYYWSQICSLFIFTSSKDVFIPSRKKQHVQWILTVNTWYTLYCSQIHSVYPTWFILHLIHSFHLIEWENVSSSGWYLHNFSLNRIVLGTFSHTHRGGGALCLPISLKRITYEILIIMLRRPQPE